MTVFVVVVLVILVDDLFVMMMWEFLLVGVRFDLGWVRTRTPMYSFSLLVVYYFFLLPLYLLFSSTKYFLQHVLTLYPQTKRRESKDTWVG